MEAGPISQITTKQEREYILEHEKTKLVLKFTINTPLLKISIHDYNNIQTYFYENTFNKESLCKISKCFLMYESVDEIMLTLINLIENKKYSLLKVNENEFDLIFKVPIFLKEEEITINLYKNYNITKDDIINSLIEKVQNLTKRVEELEKKNKEKELNKPNEVKTCEEKKTKIFEQSTILKKEEELKLIEQRLKSGIFSNKKLSYKLLYSGTKDGDNSSTFHNKCDNIQNQLLLVKTKEGLNFGGYTRLGFDSSKNGVIDKDAFLFSFDTMKCYDAIAGKETIYCSKNYGPCFGCSDEIEIPNNFFIKEGTVEVKMNRYKTNKDYELNGGNQHFKFAEVEVFQVIFE